MFFFLFLRCFHFGEECSLSSSLFWAQVERSLLTGIVPEPSDPFSEQTHDHEVLVSFTEFPMGRVQVLLSSAVTATTPSLPLTALLPHIPGEED